MKPPSYTRSKDGQERKGPLRKANEKERGKRPMDRAQGGDGGAVSEVTIICRD